MLSKEFLASLTPTHWRGAGSEELVPVTEMDPAWLENAYAMCIAWGFEQRTEMTEMQMFAELDAPPWMREARPGERLVQSGDHAKLQPQMPGALEICRERIPPFRFMEQWLATRVLQLRFGR